MNSQTSPGSQPIQAGASDAEAECTSTEPELTSASGVGTESPSRLNSQIKPGSQPIRGAASDSEAEFELAEIVGELAESGSSRL